MGTACYLYRNLASFVLVQTEYSFFACLQGQQDLNLQPPQPVVEARCHCAMSPFSSFVTGILRTYFRPRTLVSTCYDLFSFRVLLSPSTEVSLPYLPWGIPRRRFTEVGLFSVDHPHALQTGSLGAPKYIMWGLPSGTFFWDLLGLSFWDFSSGTFLLGPFGHWF